MVIYIVINTEYSNRMRIRYGIDYFSSKGYKVVVLDVRDYTNPELKDYHRQDYIKDANVFVHICSDFKSIKNHIKNYGFGVAIMSLSNRFRAIKIKKYLQANNIKIGGWYTGFIPSSDSETNNNLFQKVMVKLKKSSFKQTFQAIIRNLYAEFYEVKSYDFILTNNFDFALNNYKFPPPLKVIETHSWDYDIALRNKNSQNDISQRKFAVFIDQNIFLHPDVEVMGLCLELSEKKYYEELNNLFDLLEKKYNIDIIIAAHPTADKRLYAEKFNNRRVYQESTCKLIKYSEFTIAHYSTAITFAIIYNKPLLFLTSNEIEKTFMNGYIKSFSRTTNQPLINVSNIGTLPKIEVDDVAYKDYMQKYIKSDEGQETNFEKFEREYLNQFNERNELK